MLRRLAVNLQCLSALPTSQVIYPAKLSRLGLDFFLGLGGCDPLEVPSHFRKPKENGLMSPEQEDTLGGPSL